MDDAYEIDAYDRNFHTRIDRSWFVWRSQAASLPEAIIRAVEYVDDQGDYKSVAVWVADVPVLVFLLDSQHQVWANDIAFSVLMEHCPMPDHFQRIANIPNRWSPNRS